MRVTRKSAVAGSRSDFRRDVSEPVRLHVPAKRYLCATDAVTFANLSSASVLTLKLQGGPMSAREVSRFEGERFREDECPSDDGTIAARYPVWRL